MARLRLFDFDDATHEVATYLKGGREAGAFRSNHSRLYAHAPFLTHLLHAFRAPLQRQGGGGVLSTKIKEIAIIKTSHLNGCTYCYAHNTETGRSAGLTDEQVLAIGSDDYMESALLSSREKAAILWAEHVTKNTAKDRDDVFDEVAQNFDETEIFELTLVIGMFNMTNRVHDSLRLELEEADALAAGKGEIWVRPEKVRATLQSILDNWPESFPEPNPD